MSFNLLATQINNFLQPIQFNTCGDMCNDRMGICVLADHGGINEGASGVLVCLFHWLD